MSRKFKVGSKWSISEGSGTVSGKPVTIIPWFDWRKAEDGTYKPPDRVKEVPVRYSDGKKGFMYKSRLVPVPYYVHNPKRKITDVPTKHQIKIAKQTLKYSDVGARIMGGMTKEEARAILRKHGIRYKENPKRKRKRIEYRTVDTRTLKGLKEAERLHKSGWKMGQQGLYIIHFYRRRENPIGYGLNPRSGPVDKPAARELELYISHDPHKLMGRQYVPILRNLQIKMARGIYDPEKAVKLWMHFVDNVARHYIRDYAVPGSPIDAVFNKNTRLQVARGLEKVERDTIKKGDYREMLPKKYKGATLKANPGERWHRKEQMIALKKLSKTRDTGDEYMGRFHHGEFKAHNVSARASRHRKWSRMKARKNRRRMMNRLRSRR